MVSLFRKSHIPVLFMCLLVLLTQRALGEDISISAETDRASLSVNDMLTLSVTVKGNAQGIPKPAMPALTDFEIMSQYNTENISIINMQSSHSVTYQYILRPRKIGTLRIDAVILKYGGMEYRTSPLHIKVTKASAAAPTSPPQSGPNFPLFPPSRFRTPHFPPMMPEEEENVFATAKLNKESAYVNEQLILTVDFYYPQGLYLKRQLVPPTNTGYLVEELSPTRKFTTAIKDGRYEVEEIKFAVCPIHSGTFDINRVTIAYDSQDIFGARGTVETEPLQFHAADIPDHAPPNFINSVGKFQMEAIISPPTASTDEPLTLTLKIEGAGNFSTMSLPELPQIPCFKKFDTSSSQEVTKTYPEVRGEKTFKTILIPQKEGTLTIPSFSYSYFDPDQKKFRELVSSALTVNITKNMASATPSPEAPHPEAPREDIRYIKSDFTPAAGADSPLYRNIYFLSIQALPLLVIAAFVLQTKRRETLAHDPEKLRKSLAYRNFKKNIAHAHQSVKDKRWNDLYNWLQKSILEYMNAKYTMPGKGLTLSELKEFLQERQFPPDRIGELEEIMRACDMARFSGTGASEAECRKNLKRGIDLVNLMEKRNLK